ncbi:MAG: hypothetical protein CMI09_13705 [Oceanospirillaceae bacterium]|nr:hypothetical protein [Oceanospirillaceae bacterium]|tara:strand:- start:59 stop:529 length:471 start_codon:yes stop_codon:yes gene_type:complete
MPRLPLTSILALSVLMFLSYSEQSMAGKVYRWVDANGQVHFGSQPPPEQRTLAEQYHVQVQQASPGSTTTPQAKGSGDAATGSDEEEKIVLNSGVSDEQSKEYCQNARQFLTTLQGNSSTRFKQEDGSIRPFTAEERQSKEQQALEMIDQFCSKNK